MNPLFSRLVFVGIFAFFLFSCYDISKKNMSPPTDSNSTRAEAYVPVYAADSADTRKIVAVAARTTVSAGKIYVQGKLLFQVEKLEGVHVIDYTDMQHPVKLGFIKSRGCSELAFKNGYLIVNNFDDLVFIDVRDIKNVKETARIKAAFPQFYVDQYTNSRPPVQGKFYVCPDFYKGTIVSWKLEKNVKGAYCYY